MNSKSNFYLINGIALFVYFILINTSVGAQAINGPTSACISSTVTYTAGGSCSGTGGGGGIMKQQQGPSIGDGTLDYSWDISGGGVIVDGGEGVNYVTVQWTTTGTWTVSEYVCGVSLLVSVKDPVSLSVPSNATYATAGNIVLTGVNGSSYSWRYGSLLNPVIGSSPTFSPTKGGMYYLSSYQNCDGSLKNLSARINFRPVADAGPDKTASLGKKISLYGKGSNLDEADNLTYYWSIMSGPTSLHFEPGPSTQVLTLSNPLNGIGTYKLMLTVRDSYGISSSDDVNVTFSDSPNNQSYIQEDNVLISGQTSKDLISNLPVDSKSTTISYTDELDRAIEIIQVKGSPLGKDVVQFKVMDSLGREGIQYLPYTTLNQTNGAFIPVSSAKSDQMSFYNKTGDKIIDDSAPYATVSFENSPLGRVSQGINSGSYWQSNSISNKASFGTNTSTVLNWSIGAISGTPIAISPYYYPNSVLKSVVNTDQQNINSETFTDFRGLKILTRKDAGGMWAETYFVYDDRNNLRFVLPPELVKVLKSTSNFAPSRDQLDRWAYQYNYDNLNRQVEFKAPGAGWVYSIYDTRNRVVLTQDANQRNGDPTQSIPQNKWSYTKYDEQNRPVVSGIYGPDNTYTTRAAMQAYVNSLNNGLGYQNVPLSTNASPSEKTGKDITVSAYESINDYRASNSVSFEPGFTFTAGVTSASLHASVLSTPGDAVFPVNSTEPLSVTYYDNYNCEICQYPAYQFVPNQAWQVNNLTQPFTRLKGLITASRVKVLGANTWLSTVSYYNIHGQVIQVIGGNHVGGRDRISLLYDFSGKRLEALQTAIGYNSGGVNSIRRVYTYDKGGRMSNIKHQINSQPMVIMSAFEYNELGQVVKKNLHSVDNGANYIQSIDYRYNIHNTVTNINNVPEGDEANDFFGMDLTSERIISGAGNTPRNDGMISAIRWKNDLGLKKRIYNFTYDNLNRVTSSNHKMSPDNSLTWNAESDFYSETGITYDLNGNILSLSRNTEYFKGGVNSANAMDQLSYVYGANASDNGNQLQYVKENSTSETSELGFKDGGTNATTDPDFSYDANGSLIKDQNKKIANITYYFNNRPKQVTFNDGSYLQYTYDAAGIKLSQAYYVKVNGVIQPPVTTDYIGNIVLLNGQVLTINHDQGRITAPTYANLFTNPDAGSLEGYAANQNVALADTTINGQTYASVVCNQASGSPGVFPINTTKGASLSVRPGESYVFKVLGYQSVGSSATLYVKSNLGGLISSGITLPLGSANENWVTASFTIPDNVTSIQFGIQWNAPANSNTFYINRIALYKTDFEYNYFITDQVGSTRVVLQTTPGTQVYTATMEPKNQSLDCAANPGGENCKFANMSSAQMVASPGNHTQGGAFACKLNGAFQVGPAKSIRVYPGDSISASAYSFFINASGYNNVLSSIAGNVITTFKGAVGVGEAGSIYQNVNNAYGSGVMAGHTGSTNYPSAYLNYILFDKDYNVIKGQAIPISQTANSVQPVSMMPVVATELGYIYIYLSYENTNINTGAEVYFDDFKITVKESNVIQVNNYYPFGMESYTWLRSGETDNAYLYQGKELIAQTGWHDFGSRMYYGDLGRWFATDPQNQFASPYLAMGNNPIKYIDPNGEGLKEMFDHWGDELADFDRWTRETNFYRKVAEVAAVVVISIVTDGLATAWLAPTLETAGMGAAAAGATAGLVMGAVGGAAGGLATGLMEGYGFADDELGDAVWMGAVSGAASGEIGYETDARVANWTEKEWLRDGIKGGIRGFTSGAAHGMSMGLSGRNKCWSKAFDLAFTEGAIGGVVGFGAGVTESAFKGGNESENAFNERMGNTAAARGVKATKYYYGGEYSWSNIVNRGFYEGNIGGSIVGNLMEGAGDEVFGEESQLYQWWRRTLWGDNYKRD